MRIAFVTDELPRPGRAGHLAMNHAILSWLHEQGHQVTVLMVRARLRFLVERYTVARVAGIGIGQRGKFVYVRAPKAGLGIAARRVAGLLPEKAKRRLRRQADAVLGAFTTEAQRAWCGEKLAQIQPDAILADTIFRAPVLAAPGFSASRRIIIAHDLFHVRHRALRAAGYSVQPEVLPREAEAALLNLADGIVAIQPEEAAAISALCPERQVVSAPMPASPCPRPDHIARQANQLVFVGSDTLPNLDGLRWFFTEIWPVILAAAPQARLDLVGDCGGAFAKLPAGVRRLGRVADLSPVLHRASLAISPLRVGSGLKIKMLDYARHGLVTVATPESLQGFAGDAEAPFIEACNAGAFAQAVAGRLARPAADAAALAYVARHYGQAASFAGLAALLEARPGAAPLDAAGSLRPSNP